MTVYKYVFVVEALGNILRNWATGLAAANYHPEPDAGQELTILEGDSSTIVCTSL